MKWKLFSYFLVNRFNSDLFIDIDILFVKCTNCLRKRIVLKYMVKMYISLHTNQQFVEDTMLMRHPSPFSPKKCKASK